MGGGKAGRMQVGKMDKEQYAEDKPIDCSYCYFWHSWKEKCVRERCYYLLPQMNGAAREDEGFGDCKVCPYGQHSPCIGYCLQKILREMRLFSQKV